MQDLTAEIENQESPATVIEGNVNYLSLRNPRWTPSCGIPPLWGEIRDARRRDSAWCYLRNFRACALEFTLAGGSEYRIGRKSFFSSPGDLFIIAPGTSIRLFRGVSSKSDYRGRCLQIFGSAMLPLCGLFGFNRSRKITLPPGADFNAPLDTIERMLCERLPGTEDLLSAEIYRFMLSVVRTVQDSDEKSPEALTEFKRAADSNFNCPVTPEKMAEHCGISPSMLYRLCRKYLQCTPMEYIRLRRLNYAEQCLRQTGERVKTVAYLAGFSSSMQFIRLFKEWKGITPQAYRGDHKNSKTENL